MKKIYKTKIVTMKKIYKDILTEAFLMDSNILVDENYALFKLEDCPSYFFSLIISINENNVFLLCFYNYKRILTFSPHSTIS